MSKSITTKSGVVVELNDNITYDQNKQIIYSYMEENKTPIELATKADKMAIEFAVKSINGKTENIYAEFGKIPLKEATPIRAEIKDLCDPKDTGQVETTKE